MQAHRLINMEIKKWNTNQENDTARKQHLDGKNQWNHRGIQGKRSNNKVSKNEMKNTINKQMTEMTRKRTQKEAENKNKTKHWWENSENPTINNIPEYLAKLNRKECNTIIKTRTSMLLVKMNTQKKQIPKEHYMQILQDLPWNPEAHHKRL